ncbi:M protein [Xiburema virus]|uniref:Matrix protein n=1 Tax=Xiburema virus TaxID=1272959 RepID=A0A059U1M2_9RHAB|nr:M protein [Xiburema virus]AHZ45720.1 M protein [Xiburema virus]
MNTLVKWVKKSPKPSAPSLSLRGEEDNFSWTYGEAFAPTPHQGEELSTKLIQSIKIPFLIIAELRLVSDRHIGSMGELTHLLEEIVDYYDGPYLHKPTILLTYLMLGMHLKCRSKPQDSQKIYSAKLSEPIEFMYRGNMNPGKRETQYRKEFRSISDSRRCTVTFSIQIKPTNRASCPILEMYNIPMANNQSPPPINQVLNKYGYSLEQCYDGSGFEICLAKQLPN